MRDEIDELDKITEDFDREAFGREVWSMEVCEWGGGNVDTKEGIIKVVRGWWWNGGKKSVEVLGKGDGDPDGKFLLGGCGRGDLVVSGGC